VHLPLRNSLVTNAAGGVLPGFATPSPARTRMSRGDGGCNGMDASEAERLPPSPSDPALGQVGFSRGIDVGLGAEASGMVP